MSVQTNSQLRIFQRGRNSYRRERVPACAGNEAVRALLKTTYPEIAKATNHEVTTDDGQDVVDFLPQSGRKG